MTLLTINRRVEYDCVISGMSIDSERGGVYRGAIDWKDPVEDIEASDRWVARPSRTESVAVQGVRYGFDIKPVRRNPLTGEFDFTLLEDFDGVLRHYIMEGILKLNLHIKPLRR